MPRPRKLQQWPVVWLDGERRHGLLFRPATSADADEDVVEIDGKQWVLSGEFRLLKH